MIRKLIILKDDINDNLGDKKYIKFLDKDKKHAVFYEPIIAPCDFKEYLKKNNIKEAFEVLDINTLNKYKDKIYTFETVNGIYNVRKGYDDLFKYVIFIDKGISLDLGFRRYSFNIKDGYIYLKNFKYNYNKEYCYVSDYCLDSLKDHMIKTMEVVPGVLRFVDDEKANEKILKK